MLALWQPNDIHSAREAFQRVAAGWREDSVDFFRHDAPKVFGLIIVSFVLARILKLVSRRLVEFSKSQGLPTGLRAQQIRTLADVVYSVGLAVIIFFAGIQILQTLKINIGPLLASAGIAGLAIGFGAQTLVKDVINGFFILIENQYDIGDVVKLGGVQGAVESLTLRRTILRDADGTVHTIPNSEIKIVSNQTRDWTQLAMHVSVDYKEESDRVVKLLKEVGNELRNEPQFRDWIVAEPEVPGIERVSSSEVEYLMLVKTMPGKQFPVSRELRRRIKDCFQKQNISPGGPGRYVITDTAHPQQKV
jgi:moderate conductance mechanosensitive channel